MLAMVVSPLMLLSQTASAEGLGLKYVYENGEIPLQQYPNDIVQLRVNEFGVFAVRANGDLYSTGIDVSDPQVTDASVFVGSRSVGFVIKHDGTVWSWGSGALIGRNTTVDESGNNQDDYVPQQIQGLPAVKDIKVTFDHVVALDVNGDVWAWGNNTESQLGVNVDCPNPATQAAAAVGCGISSTVVPLQVSNLSNVKQIAVGWTGNLAVTNDNVMKTWGTVCNVEANWTQYSFPTLMSQFGAIKNIAASNCVFSAVTTDGQAYKWGGQGRSESDFPITSASNHLAFPQPVESIDFIGTGVARDDTGQAYRWDDNGGAETWRLGGNPASCTTNPCAIGAIGLDSTYYPYEGSMVVLADIPTPSDQTPPTLSALSWTQNPKTISGSTTLTVPVTDDSSGVQGGEYFIGDTDPGQSNGATLGWNGTGLSTTFGTNFQPGVYRISVRAQDNAGNWSDPVSDYLVVYDPAGPNATGNKATVPSLANGDILPGLTQAGQTDKSNFGFTVKHDNAGVISNKSDLQFTYQVGKCNGGHPVNCNSLELNATNIAWLVTDGQNLSHSMFQGVATLKVNGVTTSNPFTVESVDGSRTTPKSTDHLVVKIYSPGANPNSATPLYQISDNVTQGHVKIQ